MATAASVPHSFRTTIKGERARLGWRDNLVTIIFGLWLMSGLFVDGWAHNNLAQLETFFTPWHAIFYSGFMTNVLWVGWLIYRELRKGRRGLAAIPQGYHLGLLGVFVFGAGGVGDMLWHIVFGVEQSIDALLSPTHLLLFLGGMLVFASPFNAAWTSGNPADVAPRFIAFAPALASLTLMMTFASFMHMYIWSLYSDIHIDLYGNGAIRSGLAGVLITNLILLAPVLLMLRRWRLPFGSITFLWTLNTVMMGALPFYPVFDPIVIAFIAGLLVDGLIYALGPRANRGLGFYVVAAIAPFILWALFFSAGQLRFGLAWSIELTGGVTVMAALTGLALSLLMAPPALPAHLEAR
jgi:hypothetical protein